MILLFTFKKQTSERNRSYRIHCFGEGPTFRFMVDINVISVEKNLEIRINGE
jgi:hypothetical protein